MNSNRYDTPLENLVADYLNGHLDAQSCQRVEAVLGTDVAFRELVDLERNIKKAVSRLPQIPMPHPSFDSIRSRVERPRFALFRSPLWALPVVAVFVLMLAVQLFPASQNQGFYTLTGPQQRYEVDALRIIGRDAAALTDIREQYDLLVLYHYADAQAIDIAPGSGGDLQVIEKALLADPRVKLVQALPRRKP